MTRRSTGWGAALAAGLALAAGFAVVLAPGAARGQGVGPPPPERDAAPAPDAPEPDAAAEPTADPTPDPADRADPADDSFDSTEGEVIIIDSRSEKQLGDAVGAVDVVDRGAIRARGARTVADALRGRIGIEVVPGLRGTSVRAQGMDPTYVLILIDGLPAIGRIDGALDVDRLPVDDVERIEVVKGPSSALYGSDALGGVINIVTRDPDRPLSAEGTATYGSRDRLDASASAAGRRELGPWRVAGRAALGMRRADGYDLDSSTAGTEGPEERSGDTALRVAAERGRWRVLAGGDYLRQDLRSLDGSATGAVFDRRTLGENGAGTASVSYRPRADASLSATLRHAVFRDQFLLDQQGSDELDQYEQTDEQLTSAALVASGLVGPDHLVTGGVDGSAEQLSSARLSEDGSRQRLGVYAQDEWLVARGRQLILVPGARLDLDTQFGVHATPKLAARWDASEQVIARASAGFGYRAPDFRQLLLRFENPGVGYRVEGNQELDPETSIGGTLSVEVEPVARVGLAAQAYWNEVDDLIAIELAQPGMGDQAAVYTYVNIASARTRGAELQARWRLHRLLAATVGYTLTDTLDREADRPLPDRARHRGSFELQYRPIERLTVAAHGEVVGRRKFFADEDGDGDEDTLVAGRYAWLGARAEMEIGDHLSLFAGADNLADAGNSDFLPISPRTFYAGLRGHYDAPPPARPTLTGAAAAAVPGSTPTH